MNKVYDNTNCLLGKVKNILKYTEEELITDETIDEIIESLKEFNENDIVFINYSNGMGYSIDGFDERDVIYVGEE